MSEQMVSMNRLRICDACEEKLEYDYVGLAGRPDVIRELESWTTLTREIWNGQDWVKMVAHAKGADCVMKASVKMDIMIQQMYDRQAQADAEADAGIDLNALSAGSAPTVN